MGIMKALRGKRQKEDIGSEGEDMLTRAFEEQEQATKDARKAKRIATVKGIGKAVGEKTVALGKNMAEAQMERTRLPPAKTHRRTSNKKRNKPSKDYQEFKKSKERASRPSKGHPIMNQDVFGMGTKKHKSPRRKKKITNIFDL